MDSSSRSCTKFYIFGSILIGCVLLRLNFKTYEGMCLCSGAQMPFDKVVRDVPAYHERIKKGDYDTKQFSMVL